MKLNVTFRKVRMDLSNDFRDFYRFFQRKRLFPNILLVINLLFWIFLLDAGYTIAANDYSKTIQAEKDHYKELMINYKNCLTKN